MNSIQNVSQVFKNKRAGSGARKKHRNTVLFACRSICVLILVISCLSGELYIYNMCDSSNFDVPDMSKFTVIFATSYGELSLDLEAAVICMLSAVLPADCETETVKAMAVILRTELMYRYQISDNTEYIIYIEKIPFVKEYLTFSEQKLIYGEEYKENLIKYEEAVLETEGIYIKPVIIENGLCNNSEISVSSVEEMAKTGMNYEEILNLFFTNIAIDKFE